MASPGASGTDSLRRSPPTVALCFGTYPPQHNGGSDYLERLATSLAAAGTRVVVITSELAEPVPNDAVAGVTLARIVSDWRLNRRGASSRRAVERLLRSEDVDVLHVFFPDSVVEANYMLPAVLGICRVPLVTTFWNLGLGRRSPIATRATATALLARSRVLLSHDPVYLRHLRKVAFGRPVRWLPAGSNVTATRSLRVADAARADGPFEIAYFGQIDETRGIEDLFTAVAQARTAVDVRLVMIGSAGREERYRASSSSTWTYYERIRSLPDALSIADAVSWTPYLPADQVADRLSRADLCVLPYRRNSVGRSALAAAFDVGTPVVLGGTPEDVAPLESGRHVALVPPADADALARTIVQLSADASRRRALSVGASEAAAMFAWPRIAEVARAAYLDAAR